MIPFEAVILPFPATLHELEQAAQAFARQYHVTVQIEIRGHIALEDDTYSLLPEWFHVHAINVVRTRLGLGDETDKELLWVQPAGPGEYRLSPYVRSELAHVEPEDRDTIKADRYFMTTLTGDGEIARQIKREAWAAFNGRLIALLESADIEIRMMKRNGK